MTNEPDAPDSDGELPVGKSYILDHDHRKSPQKGTQMKFELYEVGGSVRDGLMGVPNHDQDYAILLPDMIGQPAQDGFDVMLKIVEDAGFKVFLAKPEFLTIRAKFPKGHEFAGDVADFVLCRRDGPSSDGRRPDYVEVGSLRDDLARRDLTCNAVAKVADGPEKGALVDPFMGISDIRTHTLRFVGDPMQRIREDGLRVLRGFRFQITKGFVPTTDTAQALMSQEAAMMLQSVSIERVYEELTKMFLHDMSESLSLMSTLPGHIREAIFREGLHLRPSLKGS